MSDINFIRKIYYLTQEQYNTLMTTGEVDIGTEDRERIIKFSGDDTYLIKQPAASGGSGGGMGPQGPQGPKGEKGDPGVGIEEISISESGVTDEGIIYDLDVVLTDGSGYSPSFMAPRGVGISTIDIDEDEVLEDGSIRYSITFTLTNGEIVIRYFAAPAGSGGGSAAIEAIPVETIGKITSHQTVEYDDQYLDVEGLEQVWKAAGDEFVAIGNSKVITDDRFLMRETAGLDNDITGPLAEIQSIKGNTVVWNQWVKNGNFNDTTSWFMQNGTLSVQNNVCTFTQSNLSTSWTRLTQSMVDVLPAGHVVLLVFDIKHDSSVPITIASQFETSVIYNNIPANTWTHISRIYAAKGQTKYLTISIENRDPSTGAALTETCNVSVKNINFFDLTQMFGEGNEPTSVDEFFNIFPSICYEYNTGELKSTNINGIKTVGLNAFDGQFESGEIYTSGELGASNVCGRTVNYIKTIPNAEYTLYIPNWTGFDTIYFQGYDGNFSSLGRFKGSSRTSDGLYHITTPDNCRYIKFSIRTNSSDQLIIPNDLQICFHLTHTGVKDGTYESFFTDYRGINTSQYFPDGLKGINDVCDELSPYKSIQRIGSVDLGTLLPYDLTTTGIVKYRKTQIPSMGAPYNSTSNLLIAGYKTTSLKNVNDMVEDLIIGASDTNEYQGLYIYNSSFAGKTKAEVQQALNGVIVYYELAEPVETTFDQPLYWTYGCEDFGTEEWVSSETPFLAPPAKIQYWSNFVDTLRRLPDVYVKQSKLGTINGLSLLNNSNLPCATINGTELIGSSIDYQLVPRVVITNSTPEYPTIDDIVSALNGELKGFLSISGYFEYEGFITLTYMGSWRVTTFDFKNLKICDQYGVTGDIVFSTLINENGAHIQEKFATANTQTIEPANLFNGNMTAGSYWNPNDGKLKEDSTWFYSDKIGILGTKTYYLQRRSGENFSGAIAWTFLDSSGGPTGGRVESTASNLNIITMTSNQTYATYLAISQRNSVDDDLIITDTLDITPTTEIISFSTDKPIAYGSLETKWNAKTLTVMGDSISNGYVTSSISVDEENRYYGIAAAQHKMKIGTCSLANGTTISSTGNSSQSFVKRVASLDISADLIIITGGTNDYTRGTPLGTITDKTDVSFYGALYVLCQALASKYKDKKVVFITPINRRNANGFNATYETYSSSTSGTLQDYRNAIQEVAGNMFGFTVIDGAQLGLCAINADTYAYQFADIVHINENGHRIMGEALASILNSI